MHAPLNRDSDMRRAPFVVALSLAALSAAAACGGSSPTGGSSAATSGASSASSSSGSSCCVDDTIFGGPGTACSADCECTSNQCTKGVCAEPPFGEGTVGGACGLDEACVSGAGCLGDIC